MLTNLFNVGKDASKLPHQKKTEGQNFTFRTTAAGHAGTYILVIAKIYPRHILK